MKSSEVSRLSGSILAVYLPLSTLLAFIVAAASLIRLPFQTGVLSAPSALPLKIPFAALLLPAALCGVAASCYHSLMRTVKADHSAASLRCVIIIMAASYPLASLLAPLTAPLTAPLSGSISLRFSPGLVNLAAPVCACYVWVMTSLLKELFEARELLETYTGAYRGEQLRQLVLEDAVLLSALDRLIGKTRRIALVQIAVQFTLALIRAAVKPPLPVPDLALLALAVVNGFCFTGLLAVFREEHSLAGEGLAASRRDRAARLGAAALCGIAAIAGAVLLSPGKNLLPLSLITRAVARLAAHLAAWLSRLFRPAEAGNTPPPAPLEPEMMAAPIPPAFPFAGAADAEPWPFWEWLKYGLIALAAALFIGFMVKPLFERGRSGRAFVERLRRIITGWFKDLRGAVRAWFAFFGEKNARGAQCGAYCGAESRVETPFERSFRRNGREIRAGATLFARIITWGGARGVPWKPAYGPGEYCRLLQAAFVQTAFIQTGAILRCGELFERLLYSPAGLSAGEHGEFKRLVETIERS